MQAVKSKFSAFETDLSISIESISCSALHQIDCDIPATDSHTAAGEDASAIYSALLQMMMTMNTVMVMIL